MRKRILHFSDQGDFLIENEEGEIITLQELIIFWLMERGYRFPNPPAVVECLTEAWAEVNWKEIHDSRRKEAVLPLPAYFEHLSDPPYPGGTFDLRGGDQFFLRLRLVPISKLDEVGIV